MASRKAQKAYYERNKATIYAKQQANPKHHAAQRRHTLRRYGMIDADYAALLLSQDGKCAVCRTDTPGQGRKFFDVDHDHVSGKVRGLLCHVCNKYVGSFENARRLAVEAYLKLHQ